MRFAIVIFFLSFSITVFAQQFGMSSSKWHYTNNGGTAAPDTWYWLIEYDRDTIIDGHTGRIFVNRGRADYGLMASYIFRESNDTVWSLDYDQHWAPLYIYNSSSGDTLRMGNFYSSIPERVRYVVDSVAPGPISGGVHQVTYLRLAEPGAQGSGYAGNYYDNYFGTDLFYPKAFVGSIPESATIRCYEYDNNKFYKINFSNSDCDAGNPIGLEESEKESLSFYPSFTQGNLWIKGNLSEEIQIEIFSLSGRRVYADHLKMGENQIQLPQDLPNQMYLLKYSSEKVQGAVKIRLERD